MTETFAEELANESGVKVSATDRVLAQAAKVDAQHEAMLALQAEIAELKAKNARYETPAETPAVIPGGAPVLHHLHLVDGRVIANHEGIGTHYSEVIDAGGDKVERITRVAAHYPAEEVHPNKRFA